LVDSTSEFLVAGLLLPILDGTEAISMSFPLVGEGLLFCLELGLLLGLADREDIESLFSFFLFNIFLMVENFLKIDISQIAVQIRKVTFGDFKRRWLYAQ
jgi:hypothetical protein